MLLLQLLPPPPSPRLEQLPGGQFKDGWACPDRSVFELFCPSPFPCLFALVCPHNSRVLFVQSDARID